MTRVRISSKYQVVIPKEVRKRLRFEKGQYVHILAIGSRAEMIRDVDIREMKGSMPGLSLDGIRDEEDRF